MFDLNQKISLQRAALFWEGLWQAAQKPLLVLGLAIIVFASGIFADAAKYLQIASLVALALLFLYSLKDFLRLKFPNRLIAMRKLELASNLDHRAVSSHLDDLAPELENPEAQILWQEHQHRNLSRMTDLKILKPRSAWRKFDPVAVRAPIALAAIAAVLLGPGDMVSNMQNMASLTPPIAATPLSFDAWLRPPAYTAKPPVLLTSQAMQDKFAAGSEVSAPENSSLTLHIQGATKPLLSFYPLGETPSSETEIKSIIAKTTTSTSGFSAEIKLERPVVVKLTDGNQELASWPIALIPDAVPRIKIVGEPKAEKLGVLNVGWETSDDYGVKTITTEISLADEQESGEGFENNGVFLFDAPVFKIALRHPNAKSETGNTTQDLSSHPWAGLFVEMVLTATDAAGHSVATEPKRFKMPERNFFKPLAASVIEQRKLLILNPDSSPDVATMLDAILAYPYSIRDKAGLILNLAAVKSSLAYAGDTDEVGAAITKLWPLAIAIEDGEMADARAELKALKQQLEQALRDGAPPEKIAELMDKMRKSMDRLLDQMQKEAERRKADGDLQKDGKQGREISKDELQKMLDDIKKLSESGNKEAAEKLLSELDKLLQNLQPGQGDQAGETGDPTLQNQMDELSNMMRRQQELMDKTQRLPQAGGEQQGDGSNLANRQGSLSDQLGKLGKQLDQDSGAGLGDASKDMKDAESSLRDGSKEEALQQQGEAMKKMRESADKLGKKLAEKGQGKSGKDGPSGNSEDDPLGRPRASNNPDLGPNKNTVPSEMAQRRAREILEKLRNRSNDQNLGDTEKSYIERLLRGLY